MDGTIEPLEQAFNRLAADLNQLVIESHRASHVDDAEVVTSMRVQATRWLFWAQLATHATNIYRRWNAQTSHVLARCQIRARQNLQDASKKVTDTQVKELAECDPEYQQALDLKFKAQEVMDHFKNVETALGQRVTMLKEMNQRQCREWWSLQQKDQLGLPVEQPDTPYSRRVPESPRSTKGMSLETALDQLNRAKQERRNERSAN